MCCGYGQLIVWLSDIPKLSKYYFISLANMIDVLKSNMLMYATLMLLIMNS